MNHHSKSWPLQEAKARLSELLKIVEQEGPQIITVHGKPKAEIVPVKPGSHNFPAVEDLVKAFQACPVPEFEIPRVKSHGKHRNPQF